MKRTVYALFGLGLLFLLNGCSRSVPSTPTPLPTPNTNPNPNASLATPLVSTPAVPPTGFNNVVTCTEATGWVCDAYDYNQPITVVFYANGAAGAGGELLGSTVANLEREPAVGNYCGGITAHGFNFAIPTILQDGLTHEIYAYAVGLNPPGFNSLFQDSPKTITCGSAAAITPAATTAVTSGTIPGAPSGPYSVILVSPNDVLNIRSGAGMGSPVSGNFSASATNVMRTGPSSTVNGNQWVQVQNPAGGTGWVFGSYLAEYVAPATFCTDGRVNTLLTNFGNALKTSDGVSLASLVSPAHGMTVYLWRYGIAHTFKQSDARWVFNSTFAHNWGAAPASGLNTIGSFHVAVLPNLLDVFNASYTLTCNSLGTATQYGSNPWPVEYANVNFYTVYKPGTPGVDLDFRYWLVGVEYVQGQPYIFAVIQFAWEP
jgi:hypothetical protein